MHCSTVGVSPGGQRAPLIGSSPLVSVDGHVRCLMDVGPWTYGRRKQRLAFKSHMNTIDSLQGTRVNVFLA